MIRPLIAVAATVLLASSAFAAKPAPKPAALVCPVTGDKIASVKAAAGHSSYKGKTYYFCCAGCKPEFDKAPQKFVKNTSAPKKPMHMM
jgi:YHS domain-containing protein